MSDDVSLPELFEVVFTVGQTTSTSCITINITSDTESEVDESFTISITSAGTAPYSRIVNPFIATVIIQDKNSSDSSQNTDDCDNGIFNLYLEIAIPIAVSVVVCIMSCLVGALLFRYLSNCQNHGKKQVKSQNIDVTLYKDTYDKVDDDDDVIYEDVSPTQSNKIPIVDNQRSYENGPFVTGPNQVFVEMKSASTNKDPDNEIRTSINESYVPRENTITTSLNESYTRNVDILPVFTSKAMRSQDNMLQGVISTSPNEAYCSNMTNIVEQ